MMGWFNWNNHEKYLCVWCDDKFDSKDTRDSHALDCEKAPRQQSNRELGNSLETYLMIEKAKKDEEARNLMIEKAKNHEKLLEFEEAAEIYKEYGMDADVIRVRKEARNKVEQTVVHGDQITKTEIKDSVVSKSNVGSGGKSKSEELREAKALLDDGIIDDDEFKQMKKEILGK
jgi:hypothetical protein